MREDLDLQLNMLRDRVATMGNRADEMLDGAIRALVDNDLEAAAEVVNSDPGVDSAYEQVQHGVLALVALHGPMGHDLRVATALIHVSLHLERMADYAVNTARAVERATELPRDNDLVDHLAQMGGHARTVGQMALESFLTEDEELAKAAATRDDEVDELELIIFQHLMRLAGNDSSQIEWATRMMRVARHIERYGDHGVDIAEQAFFVITGGTVDL
ncbi:MAG: phosphate signaling complex protein PhoU [Nitriliruptoraceae bacterium]